MTFALRAATLIAMSLSSGCPYGPPSPDDCSQARSDGLDLLALTGPHDGPGPTYDLPRILFGGQGSPMVVFRILVHGANPPSCLAQSSAAYAGAPPDEIVVGRDTVPRRTYAQPDGTRATHDLFVVVDTPLVDRVATTVGTHTATRFVFEPRDLAATPPLDLAGSD